MANEFKPMRSIIFVDVVREEYRHKLLHWLHHHHVQDSISQFEPYVSKYAFYMALPTPPDGERFGTLRMQMTEHYWLLNPFTEETKNKAFTEYFPPDVLKWQGQIPDVQMDPATLGNLEGDDARSMGGEGDTLPFVFAFLPMWWQDDLKGAGRTPEDGPNYRWQFAIKCPDGVSEEEMDKWLFDEVFPVFQGAPECTRILTSKVIKEVNGCQFYRVAEMWFDGPEEWHKVAVDGTKNLKKPAWAQQDVFPFIKPRQNMVSLFLADTAAYDNLSGHRGWVTMR
ncbi:acetyl-CoA hydrolase [Ruminococcaceae bacterium OttesenSCG-928-D13]|nr:acetyl-CoA hydrolase [Ruminococcaceae bacterium OttesenSCG-928-D13]